MLIMMNNIEYKKYSMFLFFEILMAVIINNNMIVDTMYIKKLVLVTI